MSVFDPKCRMVTFRLSVAEYEAAQEICRAFGYRSISLLARLALLNFKPYPKVEPDHKAHIEEMLQAIESLRAEIRELTETAATSGSPATLVR